jgi:uncharacterized iron-regulated membrane protein
MIGDMNSSTPGPAALITVALVAGLISIVFATIADWGMLVVALAVGLAIWFAIVTTLYCWFSRLDREHQRSNGTRR